MNTKNKKERLKQAKAHKIARRGRKKRYKVKILSNGKNTPSKAIAAFRKRALKTAGAWENGPKGRRGGKTIEFEKRRTKKGTIDFNSIKRIEKTIETITFVAKANWIGTK